MKTSKPTQKPKPSTQQGRTTAKIADKMPPEVIMELAKILSSTKTKNDDL